MIDWFRNVTSKVMSRHVVRGVGVGVVNKVKDDLRRKRRTKNFMFNQIGGLDKLSKMVVGCNWLINKCIYKLILVFIVVCFCSDVPVLALNLLYATVSVNQGGVVGLAQAQCR